MYPSETSIMSALPSILKMRGEKRKPVISEYCGSKRLKLNDKEQMHRMRLA